MLCLLRLLLLTSEGLRLLGEVINTFLSLLVRGNASGLLRQCTLLLLDEVPLPAGPMRQRFYDLRLLVVLLLDVALRSPFPLVVASVLDQYYLIRLVSLPVSILRAMLLQPRVGSLIGHSQFQRAIPRVVLVVMLPVRIHLEAAGADLDQYFQWTRSRRLLCLLLPCFSVLFARLIGFSLALRCLSMCGGLLLGSVGVVLAVNGCFESSFLLCELLRKALSLSHV